MATVFFPAPKEAIGLVERLAEKHGLDELSIGVLMRDKIAVSKGIQVFAKVYRPPAWAAAFDFDYDLIVELPADKWAHLTSHQCEALVDYALCHIRCEYDEKKGRNVFTLVAPNIQAFAANLRDYGLWFHGAQVADSVFTDARQVELPGLTKKGRVEAIKQEFVDGMNDIGMGDVSFENTEDGLVIKAAPKEQA